MTTVTRIIGDRCSSWASFAMDLSAPPSGWPRGDGDTDLADITAGEYERTGQRSAGCVEGQQHEADRRREQRPRMLPADRRCGRTGQEPPDVAEIVGDIAGQQALDEEQPRADADQRRDLIANEGAHAHSDRRPHPGRTRGSHHQEHVVAPVELQFDPSWPEHRRARGRR